MLHGRRCMLYCIAFPREMQCNTTQQQTRLQRNVALMQQSTNRVITRFFESEDILVLYRCCNNTTQKVLKTYKNMCCHDATVCF